MIRTRHILILFSATFLFAMCDTCPEQKVKYSTDEEAEEIERILSAVEIKM